MFGSSQRVPTLFMVVLLTLIFASAYLRLQLDFNAGHMDEYDYLFVGQRLLSGLSWPSHRYIFGADWNWYLLGVGDQLLGGVTGARWVSALFGGLSLLGMYSFTYVLWRHRLIAGVATVLFSVQSIPLFLSRFATYDIISFSCFSLALAPLTLACRKPDHSRYVYLVLAVVLMGLSVTSKYVVILYLPLLAILAFLHRPKIGVLFSIGIGLCLLTYLVIHWQDLTHLYQHQIQGVHAAGNSSMKDILAFQFDFLWPLLAVWLFALIWRLGKTGALFFEDIIWRQLLVFGLLTLPMIVYHLQALNMISLAKHLVYAQFFLVPATAALIGQLLSEPRYLLVKQGVFVVVLSGMSFLSYQQLRSMEVSFLDVSPVLKAIEGRLDHQSTILSEDPYLFRYIAADQVPQQQIKETGWLDNNRDGKHEFDDVIQAVWDAKFQYVYLNDQLQPKRNQALREVLVQKEYQLIWSGAYHISGVMSRNTQGVMSLYKRTQPPTIALDDDDLFERGRGQQPFIAKGSYD